MEKLDRQTGGFKSSGEFYVAVRKFHDGIYDGRIDVLQKATMGEAADSTGGVLVPEDWANEIYSVALETAIVRPKAIVIPMTRDTLNIQVLKDTSRASNIFGGVTITWLAEGADKYATTADPVLGNLKLTPHKAVATCFVSNELEEDTRTFSKFFTRAFGPAISFLEDDLFINATGVGQPLGIMNSGAIITIARNVIASNINADDFANLAARLLPGSWPRAVWLINQSVLSTLANDATAGANALGMVDVAGMIAMGRPIIVTEHCATTGTTGDIILADFGQYVIGDRSLIISSSRHATYSSNTYGWNQDQTMWKVVLRVDGQPLASAAITPKRGGSTVSAFVTLTTSS